MEHAKVDITNSIEVEKTETNKSSVDFIEYWSLYSEKSHSKLASKYFENQYRSIESCESAADDFIKSATNGLYSDINYKLTSELTGGKAFKTSSIVLTTREFSHTTRCHKCKGDCKVKCFSCGGEGSENYKEVCSACYGSGVLVENCGYCGGTGIHVLISGVVERCRSGCAGGKVRRSCNRCISGHIDKVRQCHSCSGTGKIKCDACNGLGNLTHFYTVVIKAKPQEELYYKNNLKEWQIKCIKESDSYLKNKINPSESSVEKLEKGSIKISAVLPVVFNETSIKLNDWHGKCQTMGDAGEYVYNFNDIGYQLIKPDIESYQKSKTLESFANLLKGPLVKKILEDREKKISPLSGNGFIAPGSANILFDSYFEKLDFLKRGRFELIKKLEISFLGWIFSSSIYTIIIWLLLAFVSSLHYNKLVFSDIGLIQLVHDPLSFIKLYLHNLYYFIWGIFKYSFGLIGDLFSGHFLPGDFNLIKSYIFGFFILYLFYELINRLILAPSDKKISFGLVSFFIYSFFVFICTLYPIFPDFGSLSWVDIYHKFLPNFFASSVLLPELFMLGLFMYPLSKRADALMNYKKNIAKYKIPEINLDMNIKM